MAASAGPSHAKPISWAPSEFWDGADGDWSSFDVRVGSSSPEQIVRVLPSTAGQALWVVSPGGCISGERGSNPSETCSDSRGGLFNPSDSNSWSNIGNYSMGLEMNPGYSDSATYGHDTIALGLSNATGGPQLDSQVVAAFENDDYYVGLFGLGNQGTNFSGYNTPNATFLTTLKERNMIPSLSWGYTAGAIYQSKGVFGSLTLGGYDSSRLVPNNVSFSLAADVSRDLTVGLQSITAIYANGSVVSLLSEPIWTFIDSTFPYIYLPIDACEEFEKAFGLVWNTTYQTYFVDDTLHESLVEQNNNITFKLGNSETGGPTVDICLPYSSFDLEMDYPLVPKNLSGIRYFPLRRAANQSQYTLGRTFLQEAYVITNYEQSNFSVFQSKYEDVSKPNIVTISLASTESHPSRTIKIGVSLGVIALILFSLVAVVLAVKKKKKKRNHHNRERDHDTVDLTDLQQQVIQEIATNSLIGPHQELPDSGRAELLDLATPSGSGNEVSELSGPSESVTHKLVDPFSPITYELMTHHTSDGRFMIQNYDARNKYTIFVANDMERESWSNIGTSTDIPCVETTITSRKPKTVDVDQSFTPTPISESLQVSPVIANFSGGITTRKGSETSVERSAAVKSVCGTTGQVPRHARLNAWQRGLTHSKYASMDMEIVIPPGLSEIEIIKPLKISKENGRRRGNFF